MMITKIRVTIALAVIVGIALITISVFLLSPRHASVAVRATSSETIQCAMYYKNAPQELRAGHADDECAVQVIRKGE